MYILLLFHKYPKDAGHCQQCTVEELDVLTIAVLWVSCW